MGSKCTKHENYAIDKLYKFLLKNKLLKYYTDCEKLQILRTRTWIKDNITITCSPPWVKNVINFNSENIVIFQNKNENHYTYKLRDANKNIYSLYGIVIDMSKRNSYQKLLDLIHI